MNRILKKDSSPPLKNPKNPKTMSIPNTTTTTNTIIPIDSARDHVDVDCDYMDFDHVDNNAASWEPRVFTTPCRPTVSPLPANCEVGALLEKLTHVSAKEYASSEYTLASTKDRWAGWSVHQKKKLLETYLIFAQKEAAIFDLIWSCHGCDSWEDIFRDYDATLIGEKARGVQIAIDELESIATCRIKNKEKNRARKSKKKKEE